MKNAAGKSFLSKGLVLAFLLFFVGFGVSFVQTIARADQEEEEVEALALEPVEHRADKKVKGKDKADRLLQHGVSVPVRNEPGDSPGSQSQPVPTFSGLNVKGAILNTGDEEGDIPVIIYDDAILYGLNDVRIGFTNSGRGQVQPPPPPPPPPAIPAPEITSPQVLADGTAGQAYTATTITAAGGVTPYHFSLTYLSPPPPAPIPNLSLTINPNTGVISGTPVDPGNYTVTVTAQDSDSPQRLASKVYNLTINPSPIQPLEITGPTSLLTGTSSVPYPATPVTAAGGVPPYTFSRNVFYPIGLLSIPTLGLSINATTGVISGTPVTPLNNYTFRVTVRDSNSPQRVVTRDFPLRIDPEPPATATLAIGPDSNAPNNAANAQVGTANVSFGKLNFTPTISNANSHVRISSIVFQKSGNALKGVFTGLRLKVNGVQKASLSAMTDDTKIVFNAITPPIDLSTGQTYSVELVGDIDANATFNTNFKFTLAAAADISATIHPQGNAPNLTADNIYPFPLKEMTIVPPPQSGLAIAKADESPASATNVARGQAFNATILNLYAHPGSNLTVNSLKISRIGNVTTVDIPSINLLDAVTNAVLDSNIAWDAAQNAYVSTLHGGFGMNADTVKKVLIQANVSGVAANHNFVLGVANVVGATATLANGQVGQISGTFPAGGNQHVIVAPAPSVSFDLPVYQVNSINTVATVTLTDFAANIDPNVPERPLVHISADTGSNFDVQLSETGSNSGVFTGQFELSLTQADPDHYKLGVSFNTCTSDMVRASYPPNADPPQASAVSVVGSVMVCVTKHANSPTGNLSTGTQVVLYDFTVQAITQDVKFGRIKFRKSGTLADGKTNTFKLQKYTNSWSNVTGATSASITTDAGRKIVNMPVNPGGASPGELVTAGTTARYRLIGNITSVANTNFAIAIDDTADFMTSAPADVYKFGFPTEIVLRNVAMAGSAEGAARNVGLLGPFDGLFDSYESFDPSSLQAFSLMERLLPPRALAQAQPEPAQQEAVNYPADLLHPVSIYDDLYVAGISKDEPGNIVIAGAGRIKNADATALLIDDAVDISGALNVAGSLQVAQNLQVLGELQIASVNIANGITVSNGITIQTGNLTVTAGDITAQKIGKFYRLDSPTTSNAAGFRFSNATCGTGDILISCTGSFVGQLDNTTFHGGQIDGRICFAIGNQSVAQNRTIRAQAICFNPDGSALNGTVGAVTNLN